MSVQPPRGLGRVRVLEIEGVDLQPCGGTHVANTADGSAGAVVVTKIDWLRKKPWPPRDDSARLSCWASSGRGQRRGQAGDEGQGKGGCLHREGSWTVDVYGAKAQGVGIGSARAVYAGPNRSIPHPGTRVDPGWPWHPGAGMFPDDAGRRFALRSAPRVRRPPDR
jgi:hypothetical protein